MQIVDVATWQKAQQVRRQLATEPRRTACTTGPLVSILRCPHCTGPMSRNVQYQDRAGGRKEQVFIYHCLTNRRLGRSACAGFVLTEGRARRAVEAVRRVESDLGQSLAELDGPRFRQLARLILQHVTAVG